MSVKVIVASEKFDAEHRLGKFLDDSDYDLLVDYDCDFYAPKSDQLAEDDPESRLMFKFRKNAFTHQEYSDAYKGLIGAAILASNRGLAGGERGKKVFDRNFVTKYEFRVLDYFINKSNNTLVDMTESDHDIKAIAKIKETSEGSGNGFVWLKAPIEEAGLDYETWFDKWVDQMIVLSPEKQSERAKHIHDNWISKTRYANNVMSGVAGYFDRYVRFPYGRITAYSESRKEWTLCLPYIQRLNEYFKELVPNKWKAQKAAADKIDPKFLIEGTVFTTITVNKNFRTAAHRDAGDLNTGFSNLAALTGPDNLGWEGAYLVLPEFRVAINCRPGDLLLVNNHEGIHGNTEITSPEDKTDRCTLVCYFRENMLELGSWDYELTRRNFVESRQSNTEHPEWRTGWNGVSPNMFESEEWAQYCTEHGGREMLEKYHPNLVKSNSSLEEFF